MSNVISCPPDEVRSGMEVRVSFAEFHDDLWIPVFQPTSKRPPWLRSVSEGLYRRDRHVSGRAPATAKWDCPDGRSCLKAIADAGLAPTDIDGLSTHHHWGFRTETGSPMTETVQDALGLNFELVLSRARARDRLGDVSSMPVSPSVGGHGPSRTRLSNAARVKNLAGGFSWHDPSEEAAGRQRWLYPFGVTSPINWTALNCQLHFDRYGTTREQIAQLAINARQNAMYECRRCDSSNR